MSPAMNRRDFLGAFLKATAAYAIGPVLTTAMASDASAAPAPQHHTPPGTMPKRMLGKTGVPVSVLGLGGAWFLGDCQDSNTVLEILHAAVHGGITYFDTAPEYGNGQSERNMGLLMGTPIRKKLFLATKTENRTYDGTLRLVENSLRNLRTDYLDLVQVHYVWNKDDVHGFGRKGGVLPALHRLRDEKVIRFIGMSGHPEFTQVRQALEMYDFDTFLGYVNPSLDSKAYYTEQLPVALKKKMGIVAMKVFGGYIPATYIGTGYGEASPALLLRYALSQPISVAIPSVSNIAQLRENIEVARHFTPLSHAEREHLIRLINPGGRPKKVVKGHLSNPFLRQV